MDAAPAQAHAFELSPQTMVPHLLATYPQARRVLDRYGLRGCGGAEGPHEPLGFFARLHGVPVQRLLDELRAVTGGADADADAALEPPGVADTIYRRFFTAGIVVMLTVGAAWGVWILWKIGFAERFTGVSIHEVNAHGHAQIFGWVGLFIMGFAYQSFPRFWHARLAAPRLAVGVFAAMVAGIATRTLAMAMPAQPWAAPAALAGGALEITAIAAFVLQLSITFARSGARFEPYLAYVFAALACFAIQAPLCVWHTWNTMTAAGKGELLMYVQTYQPVLRGLQVHGLAVLMVLGVSQRVLPGVFGVRAVTPRRAWVCFGLLVGAVVGEAAFLLAHGWTGNHTWAAAVMLPWVCLAAGSLGLAWPWRLWRRMPEADRSAKFIRAAYAWLALSMAMLLLFPLYQFAAELAFSHAYYGAIRHAITVGFVSMMIMGVAAKVVPTLNGVASHTLSPLWGPFVLVNVGCGLRVSLQTLTDWHPAFFAIVGVSGVLELTAFTWWGLHLLGIMRRGKRAAARPATPTAPAPSVVSAEHKVGDVLAWFPQTAAVFDQFGFAPLRTPVMRRTAARVTTLAQAAAMRGVPLRDLLAGLNEAIRRDLDARPDAALATQARRVHLPLHPIHTHPA